MWRTLTSLLHQRFCPPQDWKEFALNCERHQLAGFCFARLRQLGQAMPDEVAARWQRLLFRQGLENRQKMEFLEQLQQTLDCPWLLLKGPYLAERFYGGLQFRQLADLDLLVAAEDLEKAGRALQSLGLRLSTRSLISAGFSKHFLHALDWKGKCSVDLHFRVRALPFLRLSPEQLFQRSQLWQPSGLRLRVPDDQDHFVLLLLGIHDDIGRGDWKEKALMDLWLMLEQLEGELNWEEFFAARRREGLERLSKNLLALVLERCQGWQKFSRLGSHLRPAPPPPRQRWRSRLWWAQQFDRPWLALTWWGLSLPVRWHAHR